MSLFVSKRKVEEEELSDVCASSGARRLSKEDDGYRYEDGSNDGGSSEDEEEGEREDGPKVYMLGGSYCCVDDFGALKEYESSLLWATYRSEFAEMAPYGITSDAGWGCMLRAAQMMLMHAFRRHFKGPAWRPPAALAQRRADPFLRSLLTWLADVPHPQCFYSIHAMVAAGMPLKMLPGEWYGPTTAAHVIASLTRSHASRSEHVFTTHVAPSATLYKHTVNTLMAPRTDQQQHRTQTLAHPLQITHSNSNSPTDRSNSCKWDTALLLLIPLRLGLQSFNHTSYAKTLAHTFSLPQSLGFIGGSPRHALWFYAASADGQRLYGLDPHTVQPAPTLSNQKQKPPTNNNATQDNSIILLSDTYLRSLHCTRPTTMDTSKIDPSLSLAFYCKDQHDFATLCTSLQNMNEQCRSENKPILFDILHSPPDYDADVSNVMAQMCCFADSHDYDVDDNDDDHGDKRDQYRKGKSREIDDLQQLSDEDDYVML